MCNNLIINCGEEQTQKLCEQNKRTNNNNNIFMPNNVAQIRILSKQKNNLQGAGVRGYIFGYIGMLHPKECLFNPRGICERVAKYFKRSPLKKKKQTVSRKGSN